MDETPVAPTPVSQPKSSRTALAIPAAIVFGFALIAVAIYMSGSKAPLPLGNTNNTKEFNNEAPVATGPIRPVDEKDHIRGNPNAPIVIVEYSDYDCPFCKNFHETMQQVMQNYGANGQVAWVYRHFPIEQLHPSAPRLALASECVAEIAGNDGFWKFSDLVFGERGTNEPTNMTRLSEFAATAGASKAEFETCLESKRTQAAVEEDMKDAATAGAQGTPHSIVLIGDQQGSIKGAQPYGVVSQIIETLLKQAEGQEVTAEETTTEE